MRQVEGQAEAPCLGHGLEEAEELRPLFAARQHGPHTCHSAGPELAVLASRRLPAVTPSAVQEDLSPSFSGMTANLSGI